ncbi:DUF4907 domain-containing protein [Lutibacter sp. HS1-25]|uniref:DUF4907 domain-containing protein n=1 Tax=Lutibacter sp. HS1-25 TaxID=2485000 RepID=UPI00101337FA|nr:DUF4907 domain-containing protein [Lutibacter sp. HS1-25]RXP61381.1 DUF4907 domain-containing protein [Lutibacter sp. HS1-25]
MKVKVKFIVSIFLVSVFLMSCTPKKSVYTLKVFEVEQGWGYSIFQREKLIIKQQHIPSINGQKHFKSKKDAYTIGMLVIDKLKHHSIPTITAKEIKNNISL